MTRATVNSGRAKQASSLAYDLKFAERVRAELKDLPFVEKKMFGGPDIWSTAIWFAAGTKATWLFGSTLRSMKIFEKEIRQTVCLKEQTHERLAARGT